MGKVSHIVERVQTGVRLEKRLLKVLKGLAAYHELSLGDLLEASFCTPLTANARFKANRWHVSAT
jgi:hypothetical protein